MALSFGRLGCLLLLSAGTLAQQLMGDSACVPSMCISATNNGTIVEFVLQSKRANIGWLAIGFGTKMSNSPMIIMWPNKNGTVTLSQRQAGGRVMPTVVRNPPRNATISRSGTSLTGSQPRLAFTMPVHVEGQDDLNVPGSFIYGVSPTNPDNAAVDAPLRQHEGHGVFYLNLGKLLNQPAPAPPNTTTGSGSDTESTPDPQAGESGNEAPNQIPMNEEPVPWSSLERYTVAHGIVSMVGFLVLLPFGAILARYARTYTSRWFGGHWVVQFALSGPVILAGVALGVQATIEAKGKHLSDAHKQTGLALFVLYTAQCTLGAIIHFLKPLNSTRRPPQNYLHAVLGIATIGLAFWQVHTGYRDEWPAATGRGTAPAGVHNAWIAWVIIVPVLYFAGMALLPRQLRQEQESRRQLDVPLNEYVRTPEDEKPRRLGA